MQGAQTQALVMVVKMRIRELPHQLELPPLTTELKTFLSTPYTLPLHDSRRFQRLWVRDVCLDSLYKTSQSDVHSTIAVERDRATGKLLGFHEVAVDGVGLTAKNSTSLQRAPGPPSLSVKGDPTNYPFWPGGMEPVDIIKSLEKNDSNDVLDFSPANLLKVPPGFSEGLKIDTPAEVVNQEPVAITDLLFSDDSSVLSWTSQETPQEVVQPQSTEEVDAPTEGTASEQIDELLATEKKTIHGHSEAKPLSQWAIKVDVNTLVEDFATRVPSMAHTWKFTLDNFQKQAILHLESHDNVFIAAHTSAGKTVVAEYAIALSKKHMTRAIYTSPIKALSNQKFRDFRQTFGNEGIGLLTGDVQINATASCLIMTTEILRSMLYNGSEVIRDVEWVIFDEVHYVNDSERGVVWEEVLILLPDHISIIMLSATVPNAVDFADWVGRTKGKKVYVISTLKRPVPLKHHLYTGNSKQTSDQLFEIVGEDKKFNKIGYQHALDAKKQRTSKAATSTGPKFKQASNPKQDKNVWLSLIHMLEKKNLLPVVAFTFSRNRCNDNANSLSSLDLTTTSEKSEIHVFFQKSISLLKGCDRKLPQVIWTKDLLKRGIAVHHSGILPIIKEVIELLFQKGLVKLLFATETFAMGVNMPARTVVFDSTRKHDGVRMRDLNTGEYIQMAGRAGRRGLDPTGTVILLCKADIPEASDLSKMILGKPTTLESQFRLTYSMVLNLLRVETLRVEDMMKRSFAETESTKHEVDRRQAVNDLKEEISDVKAKISCPVCEVDIAECYSSCARLVTLDSQMKAILFSSPHTWKALTPGRVLTLNSPRYGYCLGVLLQQNIKSEKTLSLLVLCEADIDDNLATSILFPADSMGSVEPYKPLHELYTPSGIVGHTVVEIPASLLVNITTEVLKVEAKAVIEEFKKRLIPRFREYPLQPPTLKIKQELLKLVSNNPHGLQWLDPMKDLKIADLSYVEMKAEREQFVAMTGSYECLRCPEFEQHFLTTRRKATLEEKLSNLRFKLSESSLQFLPEYRQRLKVLRRRGYVGDDDTVQLKGRVTCELHSHEVLLTELIFQNVFVDYSPAEIAALLSAVVFQQAKCSEPNLTQHLQTGKETILRIANELAETERKYGLNTSVDDYKKSLKFGLVEVVYEWANGKEFLEITQLTDVLEGMIVRCIQRLDETCKDVRKAARVIGDPVLFQKMQDASSLIKRDIVFAASLYTI